MKNQYFSVEFKRLTISCQSAVSFDSFIFIGEQINMFYTYIIRCADNTLYTGITTDPVRRFTEHITKGKNCAKYTLSHDAVKMEALWSCEDRVSASRLEFKIKKMPKACKEKIICSPEKLYEYIYLEDGNIIYKFEKALLEKVNEQKSKRQNN